MKKVLSKIGASLVAVALLAGLTLGTSGCSSNNNQTTQESQASVKSLADLKGKTIYLCDKTVSPYLLFRALQKHTNLTVKDVKIANTSDDDIANTFLGNKSAQVAVTWNPMVLQILGSDKGAHKLFDSSEIPGEIQDLLVLNTKAMNENPDFARALVGAWYETLSVMQKGDPKSVEALSQMATLSGPTCTLENFKNQLRTTAMFYAPQDALNFTNSKEIQDKMDSVRKFCFTYGLLGETAKSADVVGISYPDGTIQGDPNNVKMRYVTQFMQEYADGKIRLDGTGRSGNARKNFTLAISIYAGWMPWYYAEENGILQKWANRYGITITVKRASYGGTIDAFTAAQADACLLTNMDTFFTPAAAGIDCSAVITGDYSNGNDAIIVR
jgi:ABC transporter binding protein (urea carboxylase system)